MTCFLHFEGLTELGPTTPGACAQPTLANNWPVSILCYYSWRVFGAGAGKIHQFCRISHLWRRGLRHGGFKMLEMV